MHQITNSLKLILEEGKEIAKEHILSLFKWLKHMDYTEGVVTLMRKLMQDLHITKKMMVAYLNDN